MSARPSRNGFASRPADPERWIKATDRPPHDTDAAGFTARLTIDVTPALRGRIKIAAFARGLTVADMLRALLAREFPRPPKGSRHDRRRSFPRGRRLHAARASRRQPHPCRAHACR
ncbi:hypothetical protein ACFSTI_00240 [Rhizorhabdus histidinilytica]